MWGFGVGLGCRFGMPRFWGAQVFGCGFVMQNLGSGFGVQVFGHRFQHAEFWSAQVWEHRFGVHVSGFRFWGSGFGVQILGAPPGLPDPPNPRSCWRRRRRCGSRRWGRCGLRPGGSARGTPGARGCRSRCGSWSSSSGSCGSRCGSAAGAWRPPGNCTSSAGTWRTSS